MTVAWVDDDANFLATIPQLLEGINTKTFNNPNACVEFFKGYKPFLQGINFRRGYTEVDSYEMPNHLPIDLNSDALQELPLMNERYNEISVLVTDYDMPGMNGLELCRKLQNQPMKKILLTGAADHQQAVQAFNEGLIDCFIQKESLNVINEVLFHIERLSKIYLIEQGSELQSHLEIERPLHLSDSVFIKFFKNWCSENKIKEYYLIDKLGTFLLIDENGNKKYFVTHTDYTLNSFIELYEDDEECAVYIQAVRSHEKIPYFGAGVDGWERTPDQWAACFYSSSVLVGAQEYYWAVVS
jgi:CheY-like chemotaxis protein